MYSDEYIDIKGTRLSSKISPTPSDFVAQLLPAVGILIVTSETSYLPEYIAITPTHTKSIIY
jgi:hypothetical protein